MADKISKGKILLPLTPEIRRILSPLPTFLVTCVDKEGTPNIVTLSIVTKLWARPCPESERPLFMIAVHPARYSHRLIEETGEFVINLPTTDLVEQVHYCGNRSGRRFNKFKETGLTPVPAKYVKVPLIDECVVNIECKVVDKIQRGNYTLFFGEAVAVHVKEGIWDGFSLDFDKAPTIAYYCPKDYRSPGKILRSAGARAEAELR